MQAAVHVRVRERHEVLGTVPAGKLWVTVVIRGEIMDYGRVEVDQEVLWARFLEGNYRLR